MRKRELKDALAQIAGQFEHMYEDSLTTTETNVLKFALEALGWQQSRNDDGEIVIVRSLRVAATMSVEDEPF